MVFSPDVKPYNPVVLTSPASPLCQPALQPAVVGSPAIDHYTAMYPPQLPSSVTVQPVDPLQQLDCTIIVGSYTLHLW